MLFFENTRKPVGLGGKLMVAMMNVGHSAVARWGASISECCAVLQGSVADMIFADDWFDAVTAFETLYFWPDLPQAAVRGLQQAVLEETDGPGICAGERRLRQMARLRDDDCALQKRQAHLSCPLASPFRTSPRERSAPCRSGRRARARAGRFSAACSPAWWSPSARC